EMFTSTVTSRIWECPSESQMIRLLTPGAFPSTTTCLGDVASVSITAGLLESILETGVCRLITTDLPTNTCKAWPSDWAAAVSGARRKLNPRARNKPVVGFRLEIFMLEGKILIP